MGAEFLVGGFVEIAHDIHFAFTAGAGAGAAEFFERDETFLAVLPFDGEFLADGLEVGGAHREGAF